MYIYFCLSHVLFLLLFLLPFLLSCFFNSVFLSLFCRCSYYVCCCCIVILLFQCFFYLSVLVVFLGYFTKYSWTHVIRTPITRKIRRNSLVPSEFTSKPLYKSSYNLNSHNSENHLNGTEYLEDVRLFEFSNSNVFNPLFLNLIFFKINTWKKVASVFCSERSQKESITKWF